MWNESTESKTLFENLMRPLIRRGIVAAALAGFIAPGLAGCYGSFPVTNALYRFNGKVTKHGFVHSIVMLILAFLGVYGITILVDAIIFNLIEFWSGEDFDTAMTFEQPDGSVIVLAPGATPDELVMTVMRDGEVLEERHFLRGEDGLVAVTDGSGEAIGTVRPTSDGGFDLLDAEGVTRERLTMADVASLRSSEYRVPGSEF